MSEKLMKYGSLFVASYCVVMLLFYKTKIDTILIGILRELLTIPVILLTIVLTVLNLIRVLKSRGVEFSSILLVVINIMTLLLIFYGGEI